MANDSVLDDLRKVCDERARLAEAADMVGGMRSTYVASPVSTAEVCDVMRVASRCGLRVVVRGGGTKIAWGDPPKGLDLILDTTMLGGIVEHAAGDLVVVARAGTRYDDLQASVGESNQRLAVDSCLPGATLGGIVATNASGPRRLLHGTVRDHLIGVTFVRADGVVAKSGGKVVKNVAGYDFGKLLTGSYGTLAVVTQVALRLHPRPQAAAWVMVVLPTPQDVSRAIASILGAQVVPSAVEVDQPPEGPVALTVLLEGTSRGVADRARTTAVLLGEAAISDRAPLWFATYPFQHGDVSLKLTTAISGVPRLMGAIRDTGARHGVAIHVRGSAAGALYAGVRVGVRLDLAALVRDLRSDAFSCGGSAVVLTMPPGVEGEVDRWGPVGGFALMQRVKDELDPEHRLAPGRFVGGI